MLRQHQTKVQLFESYLRRNTSVLGWALEFTFRARWLTTMLRHGRVTADGLLTGLG